MITFEILRSDSAQRKLKKLDWTIARRIVEHVEGLRENPVRHEKRLVKSPSHRLSVSDYKVILDIQGRFFGSSY